MHLQGRSEHQHRARPALAFLAAVALLGALIIPVSTAQAHGSMQQPPSRSYTCYFLTKDDPACKAVWDANPQALFDWMEVNISDAAGNHQSLIPDGKLCSANRGKYAALDQARADWPATDLTPDTDGQYTLTWESWAPHETEYRKVYLTKEGFDPTEPLAWL